MAWPLRLSEATEHGSVAFEVSGKALCSYHTHILILLKVFISLRIHLLIKLSLYKAL